MRRSTDSSTPSEPEETLVEQLIAEIASVRGAPKTDLPWLADTVDVEALERIWQSADDTLTLSFQYHGCQVTIGGGEGGESVSGEGAGDGAIDVVELD